MRTQSSQTETSTKGASSRRRELHCLTIMSGVNCSKIRETSFLTLIRSLPQVIVVSCLLAAASASPSTPYGYTAPAAVPHCEQICNTVVEQTCQTVPRQQCNTVEGPNSIEIFSA